MREKKRKRIVLSLVYVLLLIVSLGYAGDEERLFQEANTFFQSGQYSEALGTYEAIMDLGYQNGALHYNIGNCYYKLENIGRAILHYERALKWMPGDEDLKANLALANLAVTDKITPRSQFILIRILRGFVHLLPLHIHIVLFFVLYILGMGFLILFIITRKRFLRMIGFRSAIVAGVLFLIFGLFLFSRIQVAKKQVEAVILADRVDVMSSPSDEEGLEVFSLHEGTKVRIDQQTGEWLEIILADGKVGWVRKEVLEII
ncbi:tetratricopeptide repeat protein [bacterium]